MKRAVCLVLIVVLLCACALPAAAAGSSAAFRDKGQIGNVNAVTMLVDLGLISGYSDGTFRPANPITRAEMAKIIAILCEDDPQAGGLSFGDAADSWAARYISYCAGRGIVSGDGTGLFRPNDEVTARELAKMLLVVLGYPQSRYVGALWSENVDADADACGLYNGLTGAYDAALTREGACQLVYNALRSSAVASVAPDGTVGYVLDALMTPRTYLEIRYQAVRYTGVVTGNECADLTQSGGRLAQGVTKLAGHREFQVASDLSMLGRSVDIYVRDGQVIGIPCRASEEVYYTFTDTDAPLDVCADVGYSVSSSTQYYYNFAPATDEIMQHLPSGAGVTVVDHTGDYTIDVVLVTDCRTETVKAVSPLTVSGAGTVEQFDAGEAFRVGDRVACMDVRGTTYIRHLP